MKKILIYLLIIAAVAAYLCFSAWSDYTWADRYLAGIQDKALVFSKQDNAVDLIHFYTLFKAPITRIGSIPIASVVKRGSNTFFVKEVWADKEIGGGVSEEAFQHIIDCKNQRNAWMKDPQNGNITDHNIGESQIVWSNFDKDKTAYASQVSECKLLDQEFGE